MLDLKAFERILQQSLRFKAEPVHIPTAAEMLRYDPQMPRAVAEYQAKKMAEASGGFNYLAYEYAGIDSVPDLAKLSLMEAAARWLRARGPQWKQELAFQETTRHPPPDCRFSLDSLRAAMAAKMKFPEARILGSTVSQDSIAYVLVAPGDSPGVASHGRAPYEYDMTPGVVILHRVGDSWKIYPLHDMPQSTGTHTMGFAFDCEGFAQVRQK